MLSFRSLHSIKIRKKDFQARLKANVTWQSKKYCFLLRYSAYFGYSTVSVFLGICKDVFMHSCVCKRNSYKTYDKLFCKVCFPDQSWRIIPVNMRRVAHKSKILLATIQLFFYQFIESDCSEKMKRPKVKRFCSGKEPRFLILNWKDK